MAADCNKPIWSLHLNSKCEISSLAKRRRRRRRRPFALAPSLCVFVCVWTCRAGNASWSPLRLPLLLLCRPLLAQRTQASIGIAMFVLAVVCLSVRLSICLIWVYATFMLINTFMTCSFPFPTLRTGNWQFGLNFNWPIWAGFGIGCNCQAAQALGLCSKWAEIG